MSAIIIRRVLCLHGQSFLSDRWRGVPGCPHDAPMRGGKYLITFKQDQNVARVFPHRDELTTLILLVLLRQHTLPSLQKNLREYGHLPNFAPVSDFPATLTN